ncbi:MAG: hypothetical protein ABWJ97_08145 [Thermoproteus sp.]
MSRARTLKEIEERRAQYSRYIWMAVVLSMAASIVGISIYIALGLPSYFLFGEIPNAMVIASYVLAILSAITGYLSKSGVLRGEYPSAYKLLAAAVALSAISIALSVTVFTPLMDNIALEICQTRVTASSNIPICISNFKFDLYISFGIYLVINIIAVVMYLTSKRALDALLAYYRPARRG